MPFDVASIRARLPGRRIEWFDEVDSTMTIAARFARDGCYAGTVVGADTQSAGIGRHGRVWRSEAGEGLCVSMVLRLRIETSALPLAMLALGLATQDAISETAGIAADLRWPNDVLIEGRKCAGVLAHLEGGAIVAGIGINVNQKQFPADLASTATSLRMAGRPVVSREDLLVALVNNVETCCSILIERGPATILEMFARASSYTEGRRVRAERDGVIIEGVTWGLDPSGFLVVREDNGRETTILAGGVRPAGD